MKKVRTHKFNGVVYDIDLDTECAGYCENPVPKGPPTLFVGQPIDTKQGLIYLLHEALHASCYATSEDKVDQASQDIGSFLWRLGFRK